jgi:hypothetical protein
MAEWHLSATSQRRPSRKTQKLQGRRQNRSPLHFHLPGVTPGHIQGADHAGAFVGAKKGCCRFSRVNGKSRRYLDQSTATHNCINSASKDSSSNKYQQAEVGNLKMVFRTEGFFLVLYKNYK